MSALAIALLFRAFTFGGRAVSTHDGDLVIHYPFGRKSFRLADIGSAWMSERVVEVPDYATGLIKVPTKSYVPQVTIAFHGGKTVNLPTALLSSGAAKIATDLAAIIPAERGHAPLSR